MCIALNTLAQARRTQPTCQGTAAGDTDKYTCTALNTLTRITRTDIPLCHYTAAGDTDKYTCTALNTLASPARTQPFAIAQWLETQTSTHVLR